MRYLLLLSLSLVLSLSAIAQRQNVSGQVFGPDGAVANVSVREIDEDRRVCNHTHTDANGIFSFQVRNAQHYLQFHASGYRTLTHKMLGQKRFKVNLQPCRVSSYAGQEKLVLKSNKLFCGRYLSSDVSQMAWVEQLNDTIFSLILPIRMDLVIDEYPAGRTLLILGPRDEQVMQWENVVDAYPLLESPDEINEYHLTQSYFGVSRLPGGNEDDTPLYAYPHFQFTRSQLEYLCQHPDALQRLVVDTYKADNYWNLYPTAHTQELLQKILGKHK